MAAIIAVTGKIVYGQQCVAKHCVTVMGKAAFKVECKNKSKYGSFMPIVSLIKV